MLGVKPVPLSLRSPKIPHGLNLSLPGEKVASNLLPDGSTPSPTVPL